ncbi:MAG TPA: FecR family protein [Bryobacteraceae bacterium]|jgi:hypothetical protein|nr:FecR family protein [Bryobacteraceae bacterium]
MKQDLVDQAVAEIRSEAIDPSLIEAAAARVRARIVNSSRHDAKLRQIHGCADFQALIPQYLNGSLPEAGRLLLDDHVLSCVPCRHAMEFARTGKLPTLRRPVVMERKVPLQWRAAVAAMVVCTVGIGSWSLYRFIVPNENAGAVVKSVSGALLAVSAAGQQIFAGTTVADRQHVRTKDGSDAILRLGDGSEVELAPRSEIWMERTSYETTIHLMRGSVIVHAAKQRKGALHVATRECRVSVKGTIFAVTEGVKGSRVSVVQGAVQVEQGKQVRLLSPGQQATTSAAVEATSVPDEVAWSRDSAKYLAVLGEFSAMAKQLSEAPQPGLRYSSKLAPLAPQDTVVYASVPNVGPLLSQASQIFNDRLSQSEVLSQWWNEHHPQDGPTLDSMVQKIRTFSDYLGNEISLAVTLHGDEKSAVPLVMAEITRPGLLQFLQEQAQQMNIHSNAFQVLTQLPQSEAPDTSHPPLFAYISGNYLFISTSVAQLAAADQAAKGQADKGNYRIYSRIEQAYTSGADWLFAADMEQIRATSVKLHEGAAGAKKHLIETGIDTLDTVVLERKNVNGEEQSSAALGFSGDRQGIAGWLAAPGPVGSLDFVSPDASMATSAVMKSNGAIVWNLLHSIEQNEPEAAEKINALAQGHGMSLFNTLANSLGGDFTFAIDGALLPKPSWKVAVEVYNPGNCEWAIEQLVDGINQQPESKVKLQLTKTESGTGTFYRITAAAPFEIDYTYVDNYLVAAASKELLTQAIQNRSTGYTLSRSDKFRQQLPADGNIDFSALLYYNAGPALSTLAEGLNATNTVSPAQKQAISNFAAASKPGLVYAYAGNDTISVSSKSGFLGLNMDTLSLPAVLAASMHKNFPSGAQLN